MTLPADSDSPPDGEDGASDLGTALQAYALAQLYRIDEHLERRGHHPHAAVHETRKAVRRFRSVAALCQAVAPAPVRDADAAVRSIGKKLSRLRDAHVVTQTAAAQRKREALADLWRGFQTALKEQRDALLARMLTDDPAFARLRKRAVRVAKKIARTSFGALTGEAVVLALRDSAARITAAERDAHASARLSLRHRWRRRVRRLRLQLECLRDIADDELTLPAVRAQARRVLDEALETMPSASALGALADTLGREQDLANLRSALRRQRDLPFRDELLDALNAPRRH